MRSDRTLTFIEFLETVENFAGALQSFGVQPRDRIALHGNNSIDVFVAFLAIQFVNATAVLCKTTLTVRTYQCSVVPWSSWLSEVAERGRVCRPTVIHAESWRLSVQGEMLYQCKTSDVKFIITDNHAYEVAVDVSNELSTVEMVIFADMEEAPDGYADFKTMPAILSERFLS